MAAAAAFPFASSLAARLIDTVPFGAGRFRGQLPDARCILLIEAAETARDTAGPGLRPQERAALEEVCGTLAVPVPEAPNPYRSG